MVDYKTYWIFRCDYFILTVIAKYLYWVKSGTYFRRLNFELLLFTVSLWTIGMASERSTHLCVLAPSEWLGWSVGWLVG